MELLCPCGKGCLIKKVTRNGLNIGRSFYKCPGSRKGNDVIDCKFFSFEDELRMCECNRGFCRNVFSGNAKYWSCCLKEPDSCGFSEMITSNWRSPSRSTPRSQFSRSTPQSQSSSSQGTRGNLMSSSELLSRSLELAQSNNDAFVSLIQEFASCQLEGRDRE